MGEIIQKNIFFSSVILFIFLFFWSISFSLKHDHKSKIERKKRDKSYAIVDGALQCTLFDTYTDRERERKREILLVFL